MEKVIIRVAPINGIQKDILIEFMQQHEDLQSGRFTKDFTFKKAQELWQEICLKLNAVPGGANKDWRQWRKTWQDLKKNIKTKVAKEKKYSNGTGGGPENKTMFNATENSILNMMSPLTMNGNPNVTIPHTEFQFENVSSNTLDMPETEKSVDEQVVSVETHVEDDHESDHTYVLKHVETSTPNKKFKRLNKTRRLEDSIKINQSLVKIEEEKKNILENYYMEKLRYLQNKNLYEKEKLACLQKANDLQRESNEIQNNILKFLIKSATNAK